jgi:pantoate kinase
MALFRTKDGVNPRIRYPDAYYKPVWLDKKMFDGVAWVAKFERVTKKKATRMLLERGFSRWFNEKIKEDRALRELESKPHLTRFVLEYRKFAKEHGMDISKFI